MRLTDKREKIEVKSIDTGEPSGGHVHVEATVRFSTALAVFGFDLDKKQAYHLADLLITAADGVQRRRNRRRPPVAIAR